MHALRALLVGQLLLRSCVAGFAASLLWPSSRLERRAEKMARLLGPSPLDEKDDKVEDGCPHALVEVCSARGIRKPAGSRVLISETDAGTLVRTPSRIAYQNCSCPPRRLLRSPGVVGERQMLAKRASSPSGFQL